jgi:hypothetical protein
MLHLPRSEAYEDVKALRAGAIDRMERVWDVVKGNVGSDADAELGISDDVADPSECEGSRERIERDCGLTPRSFLGCVPKLGPLQNNRVQPRRSLCCRTAPPSTRAKPQCLGSP